MKRERADLSPGEIATPTSSIFAALTLARWDDSLLHLHFQLDEAPSLANFPRYSAIVKREIAAPYVHSVWERVWP